MTPKARPANDDMVKGYMDGRDMDCPEPSSNRSHSYRHGFEVGRTEKLGKRQRGTFEQIEARADTAMLRDEMQ